MATSVARVVLHDDRGIPDIQSPAQTWHGSKAESLPFRTLNWQPMDVEPVTFGTLDQPLLGSTPPGPGIYGPVKVQALSSSVAGATVWNVQAHYKERILTMSPRLEHSLLSGFSATQEGTPPDGLSPLELIITAKWGQQLGYSSQSGAPLPQ